MKQSNVKKSGDTATLTYSHRIKDERMETTVHISSSSQSSIAPQQKIVLAYRSLCSRQESGGGEGGGVGRGAGGAYRLAHPPR